MIKRDDRSSTEVGTKKRTSEKGGIVRKVVVRPSWFGAIETSDVRCWHHRCLQESEGKADVRNEPDTEGEATSYFR